MRSLANKRGERERSPLVSPFRLNMLTTRYFFACGLNVVWSERIRPGKGGGT
jgi:hypothetical protein